MVRDSPLIAYSFHENENIMNAEKKTICANIRQLLSARFLNVSITSMHIAIALRPSAIFACVQYVVADGKRKFIDSLDMT